MKEGLNIQYLLNFYEFLVFKKGKKLFIFLLIVFVSSLLPYIIVARSLDYDNQVQLKNYYGDGSILTLCSGILLSYFTVFFNSKKKKQDEERKDDDILIAIAFLIIYALVLLQFYLCQTENRDWTMIINVIIESTLLLLLTLGVSAFLHFREDISYLDIQKYIEEKKEKKLSKKAKDTKKTNDGVQL